VLFIQKLLIGVNLTKHPYRYLIFPHSARHPDFYITHSRVI